MDARKIVLVTGTNAGLGYEIFRALCAYEVAYEVLVSPRSLTKAEDAIQALGNEFPRTRSRLRATNIDLEDDSSIESALEAVQTPYGDPSPSP